MIELGILADDLTGGMMVASLLEREGIECPLVSSTSGLAAIKSSSAKAVVVARKIRLIKAASAAQEARQTVQAFKEIDCHRFYYKYCATFDSTKEGNIGPVAEAMMDEIGTNKTLFSPAFPEHTVTVFQGRMFLGSTPLGESFKRHDPVTPMTNSNLIEVLQPQCKQKVGLISHANLANRGDIEKIIAREGSPSLYIVDSTDDDDMARIADFAIDWPLTTGADALPIFLARTLLERLNEQPNQKRQTRTHLPASPGQEIVIAGSCARPTLRQIEHFESQHPVFRIDLLEASENHNYIKEVFSWMKLHNALEPVAVATSVDVNRLEEIHAVLGRAGAAQLADKLLGQVAKKAFETGTRRFVVAGGETSGQVVNTLGIKQLEVSTFDELGGGYCHQAIPDPLSLVLKAGALGKPDFFSIALHRMREANERYGD